MSQKGGKKKEALLRVLLCNKSAGMPNKSGRKAAKAAKAARASAKQAKPLHPNSRRAYQMRREGNKADAAMHRSGVRQAKDDALVQKLGWFREYLVHVLDVGGAMYTADQDQAQAQGHVAAERNEFTNQEVCDAIVAYTARGDRVVAALQAELLECQGKRQASAADVAKIAAGSGVAKTTKAVGTKRRHAAGDRRAADIMAQIQELEERKRLEFELFASGGFQAPDLTMKRVVVALRRWDGQSTTQFARWRAFRLPPTPHPVIHSAHPAPAAAAALNDAANPFGMLESGGGPF
jgi:Translation machinery-associated protein 16